jgi:hypothetical protein
MIYVFTSAATNYLPKVRLLAESVKRFHPDVHMCFALADQKPSRLNVEEEPFDEVIAVEELDVPGIRAWIFSHTLVELATAIKPFVLRQLLARPDCEGVLFFDPDIVLFSRLDDMLSEFTNANIILTPHLSRPEEENNIDAIMDNEICALRHGIFNLGFIGVRNTEEGRRFTNWWLHRVYHFCRAATQEGLFTDQKWIDFVPVFFEKVTILKAPRFNVASWNLTTRKFTGSLSKGFKVDGEPLGFYHFTGFDSGAHRIMSAKNAPMNRAVQSLVRWYEKQQRNNRARNTRWAYSTFSNGEPITDMHRLVYRTRRDLREAFSDPFECKQTRGHPNGTAQSYYDWLRQQARFEYPEALYGTSNAPIATCEPIATEDGAKRVKLNYIKAQVRLGLRNRRHAALLARRIWSVLRSEGFVGLKARLFGRFEE